MDSQTYSIKDVEKLFDAGAHLGHKKNRLHPKAKKYLYKMDQGVSVIDLTITASQIDKVKKFLTQAKKDNKTLLVVATKKVISQFATELCQKYEIPFITTKWLPGLITNFQTIIKNVQKLKGLKEDKEKGSFETLVKHERMKINKQIARLQKFYGGLEKLEKKPDILFVVDIKKEKNSITEGQTSGITTVAITDTNSNPDLVNYPIVANDDSATSLQYLVSEVIEAFAKK